MRGLIRTACLLRTVVPYPTVLRDDGHAVQTLFCPGHPGTGKTVLTSVVVEHLAKLSTWTPSIESIGSAYAYCNYKETKEQTKEQISASFLKQLIRICPKTPETIHRLLAGLSREERQPSLFETTKALTDAIETFTRTFFIIDAINECDPNTRGHLLSLLFDIQRNRNANLFVTSRCIKYIEEKFSRDNKLFIRADKTDIVRYIEARLKYDETRGWTPQLRDEIAQGIAESADGM